MFVASIAVPLTQPWRLAPHPVKRPAHPQGHRGHSSTIPSHTNNNGGALMNTTQHGAKRLAGIVLLALAPAWSAWAAPFSDEAQQVGQRYLARLEQLDAKRLMLEGRLGQANQLMLQFVPDGQKTAADYFVLGNMLFRNDPAASLVLMKKAEALRPDEPLIWLERGMQEHRAHNCAGALPYYDRFHASDVGRAHRVSWAYSAHCRLVLGDADKALADWRNADFARSHTRIESAMHDIFSSANTDREREVLLDAAPRGGAGPFCELMELETYGERDWWNMGRRPELVEQDASTARHQLKGDARALAEFELCYTAATRPDELVQRLRDAGYWGGARPTLPRPPRLAYMAVRALVSSKAATPQDIVAAWGGPLAERLAAAPDDRTTMDLLAFLYAHVDDAPRLAEVDRLGWKRHHLSDYAASYVAGRSRAASPDLDAEVAAAFAEFPDARGITAIRAERAKGDARLRALMDYVASQFASVGRPDSPLRRLSYYMAMLEGALEASRRGGQ